MLATINANDTDTESRGTNTSPTTPVRTRISTNSE